MKTVWIFAWLFAIIVAGNIVRVLWPWSPYLGIAVGAGFWLGRWSAMNWNSKPKRQSSQHPGVHNGL